MIFNYLKIIDEKEVNSKKVKSNNYKGNQLFKQ